MPYSQKFMQETNFTFQLVELDIQKLLLALAFPHVKTTIISHLCEDMFTRLGDADYNDTGAKFRVEYLQSGEIIIRIKYLSNGANLHQSLGFNFPDYSASDVLNVEGSHNKESSALTFNLNGTEAGISSVNIIAAGTVSEMIPPYANTKHGEKLIDVPEQVIKIKFKPGTGPAASMPTNTEPIPFLVINHETGKRVGYPGRTIPGTALFLMETRIIISYTEQR